MRRSEATGLVFLLHPEIVLRPPAICSQGIGWMHPLWVSSLQAGLEDQSGCTGTRAGARPQALVERAREFKEGA